MDSPADVGPTGVVPEPTPGPGSRDLHSLPKSPRTTRPVRVSSDVVRPRPLVPVVPPVRPSLLGPPACPDRRPGERVRPLTDPDVGRTCHGPPRRLSGALGSDAHICVPRRSVWVGPAPCNVCPRETGSGDWSGSETQKTSVTVPYLLFRPESEDSPGTVSGGWRSCSRASGRPQVVVEVVVRTWSTAAPRRSRVPSPLSQSGWGRGGGGGFKTLSRPGGPDAKPTPK